MISDYCGTDFTLKKRRLFINKRKLEMLSIYRDSVERRIAAINASIEKLNEQIERDQEEII